MLREGRQQQQQQQQLTSVLEFSSSLGQCQKSFRAAFFVSFRDRTNSGQFLTFLQKVQHVGVERERIPNDEEENDRESHKCELKHINN